MTMEVKCVPTSGKTKQHMQESLEQSKSYGNLLKDTERKIFMVINVDPKVSEHKERSIELLCATGVSEEAHTIAINTSGKIV